MNCWEILEINPTDNVREIKRAYAAKSKVVHPEEHPEEFRELHEAYETALGFAKSGLSNTKVHNSTHSDIDNELFEVFHHIQTYEDDTKIEDETEDDLGFEEAIDNIDQNIHNQYMQENGETIERIMSELESLANMSPYKANRKWKKVILTDEFISLAKTEYFISVLTDFTMENPGLPRRYFLLLGEVLNFKELSRREKKGIYGSLFECAKQANIKGSLLDIMHISYAITNRLQPSMSFFFVIIGLMAISYVGWTFLEHTVLWVIPMVTTILMFIFSLYWIFLSLRSHINFEDEKSKIKIERFEYDFEFDEELEEESKKQYMLENGDTIRRIFGELENLINMSPYKANRKWSKVILDKEFIELAKTKYFISILTDFTIKNPTLPRRYFLLLAKALNFKEVVNSEQRGMYRELYNTYVMRIEKEEEGNIRDFIHADYVLKNRLGMDKKTTTVMLVSLMSLFLMFVVGLIIGFNYEGMLYYIVIISSFISGIPFMYLVSLDVLVDLLKSMDEENLS